jgi:radical SAM superfamily enzyme YgiQ (UPF0313 family)
VEASRLARQAGAVVVWGGPHPTLFADEVAAEPFVDHVVRGSGALPFARVLADLRAGAPVHLLLGAGDLGPFVADLRRRGLRGGGATGHRRR